VVDDGEVEKYFKTKKIYLGDFIVVKSTAFKDQKPLENLIVSRTRKGARESKIF
jgi:hypothetical protein